MTKEEFRQLKVDDIISIEREDRGVMLVRVVKFLGLRRSKVRIILLDGSNWVWKNTILPSPTGTESVFKKELFLQKELKKLTKSRSVLVSLKSG